VQFSGPPTTENGRRTRHSETTIERNFRDCARLPLQKVKGFSIDQIRISTGYQYRRSWGRTCVLVPGRL